MYDIFSDPTYKQPAESARQGHSLNVQTPQQTLPQEPPLTQKPETPLKAISIEPPRRSCSSCSLPTTTTQAPVSSFIQPNQQNVPSRSNDNNFRQNPASVNTQYPDETKTNQPNTFNSQSVASPSEFPANQKNNDGPVTYSQQGPGSSQNTVNQEVVSPKHDTNQQNTVNSQNEASPAGFSANQENNDNRQTYSQSGPGSSQNSPNREVVPPKLDNPEYYATGPQISQPQDFGLDNTHRQDTGGRTAKKYEGQDFNEGQTRPNKPTLISAQMQIVDKNTDIYQRGPGEKEGLPNGLTKGDMTQLLYTFNYTVGFHGHFEEGYRNGAKQGYYYVTGRNGVRTRVDYVADEKGFRPKITQEVLDLLSEDVPKPETEKEEKYGLKGYEFKWLYFPVQSNRR